MTANDIHISEWVFAENNGKKVPVQITAVNDGKVVATNQAASICNSFSFEKLSPIPLTGETVKLFVWDKTQKISVQLNKESGKIFVRYISDRNVIKKNHKLDSIHELQQFHYRLFNKPLCLALC